MFIANNSQAKSVLDTTLSANPNWKNSHVEKANVALNCFSAYYILGVYFNKNHRQLNFLNTGNLIIKKSDRFIEFLSKNKNYIEYENLARNFLGEYSSIMENTIEVDGGIILTDLWLDYTKCKNIYDLFKVKYEK